MIKDPKDNRLLTIFRLTERCNQKCVFCCQEGRGLGGEPDITQVKRDLVELRNRNIRSIMFMHGETLLRKDLPEIAVFCRSIGFDKIGVATNGTRLTDAALLYVLLDSGINRFEVSIHSHLQEPATLISGRKFTWEKQRMALENLSRAQAQIDQLKLNTVICRHNMDHLPELADYFFSRISPDNAVMMLKHPFIMGSGAESTDLIPSYSELDLDRFIDHVKDNTLPVRFENLPLCMLPGLEHFSNEAIDRVRHHVYYTRMDGEDFYRDKSEGGDNSVLLDGCRSCSLVSICRGVDGRYIEVFDVPDLPPSKVDPHEVVKQIFEL